MKSMGKHPSNFPVYSQQLTKNQNSTLLFNLIRERPLISRAELARISGLSPSTVTVLTDELHRNQWIVEIVDTPPTSERGRRPIFLEVNASLGYVVVININNDGYMCSLYDICQNKLASTSAERPASTSEQVYQSVLALLASEKIPTERLLGIHILYPGLFHPETGELRFSSVVSYQMVMETNLMSYLQEKLPQVHICISNNSRAIAYGVYVHRGQKPELPMLAVSVNEGVGAGFMDRDTRCIPVEIGHVVIDPQGPLCECGNRGCLESYCSTNNLLKTICEKTSLELAVDNVYGSVQNWKSMSQVAQAYHRGQPDVVAVIREFAYHLCTGLVSTVNLFSVRSVFLGGIIHLFGEPFLALMEEILRTQFRIVTEKGFVDLELFEYDFENDRKAAVQLTLEYLFRRT